jgi:hypothetical protein
LKQSSFNPPTGASFARSDDSFMALARWGAARELFSKLGLFILANW